MNKSQPGQTLIHNTDSLMNEINELIHVNLNKEWMAGEWQKKEAGELPENIHPLVNVAFTAHQQINQFIKNNSTGMTPEIFELSELAIKINEMKRRNVKGLQFRLNNLISFDFNLYRTARYEIQIAGMLLQRSHQVEFLEEGISTSPDILVSNPKGQCEIECKHKEPNLDQIDYIQSIYNNTQTARKQFSKQYPGVIFIEIKKSRYDEFEAESNRLKKEIVRALRNSSSISAILLSSKIAFEEKADYVYRHRVLGFTNQKPRHSMPNWLSSNLVDN